MPAADVAALVGFMSAPLAMATGTAIADWLADPGFREACAAAERLRASLPVHAAEAEEQIRAALSPYMQVSAVVFRGSSMPAVSGQLEVPDAVALEAAQRALGEAGFPVWNTFVDGNPDYRLDRLADYGGRVTLHVQANLW